MRDDRPASSPCSPIDTPGGRVWDMDVQLSHAELVAVATTTLRPARGYTLEPWVRVTRYTDDMIACGVAVVSEDDAG